MSDANGWDSNSRTKVFVDALEHQCPERERHRGIDAHDDQSPEHLWGPAIQRIAYVEGTWWAHNSEYATQVSFCPWCGRELAASDDTTSLNEGNV